MFASETSKTEMMEYLIIIEKTKGSYGAYATDLPGVGVVGETKKEAVELIKKAIQLHLEDLKTQGLRLPKPQNEVLSIAV